MLRNTFVSILFSLLILPFSLPLHAAFDEGIDYQLVTPPQATSSGSKIEVVEMFWYGCPHCYRLEPAMKQWVKSLPADVEFVRIPAVFRPDWELHAKAYYTAEVLGVLDKIHDAFFDTIHRKREHLHSQKELADFFVTQGVDRALFNQTFNSFAVMTKASRAKQLSQDYGINGVPSLIINGKYRTSATLTGSRDKMFKVLNYLIAKERN